MILEASAGYFFLEQAIIKVNVELELKERLDTSLKSGFYTHICTFILFYYLTFLLQQDVFCCCFAFFSKWQ